MSRPAGSRPASTPSRSSLQTAPLFGALADGLPNGVYQPGWLRDQQGFYQALGTQIALVMTGQKAIPEALKQAQDDCTAVLKQSGDLK